MLSRKAKYRRLKHDLLSRLERSGASSEDEPFRATDGKSQDIGGPHTGDVDEEGYVLDLDDFSDLDETFAEELVSLISIACANDVEVTGVVAAAAGTPTSLACDGEECFSDGECLFQQGARSTSSNSSLFSWSGVDLCAVFVECPIKYLTSVSAYLNYMLFSRPEQQTALTLKKIYKNAPRFCPVPCALSRIYADVACPPPRQYSARDDIRRPRLQLRQRWRLDGNH